MDWKDLILGGSESNKKIVSTTGTAPVLIFGGVAFIAIITLIYFTLK